MLMMHAGINKQRMQSSKQIIDVNELTQNDQDAEEMISYLAKIAV